MCDVIFRQTGLFGFFKKTLITFSFLADHSIVSFLFFFLFVFDCSLSRKEEREGKKRRKRKKWQQMMNFVPLLVPLHEE